MYGKKVLFTIALSCICLFGGMVAEAATTNQTPVEQKDAQMQMNGKCPHSAMSLLVGEKIMALLKMDVKTFHAELKSGKTILQIAEEKGVKKQQLIDLIVKEMTVKIDEKVSAGEITKEKAIWLKKYLPVRAEMFITKPSWKCPQQKPQNNQRPAMVE